MALRITKFILIASVVILANACSSSSREKPDTLPQDSTTIFNDSTAAA